MGDAERERRARALLAGVVALYAAGLAALALTGLHAPVLKTLVVPALFVVAVLTRRLAAFVRDWALFLGALVLFDSLRAWIFAMVQVWELPIYMGYVIRLEEALLGGATLPTILQAAWLRPGPPGPLERALVVVHGSHFVAFLLFGLALWLLRREAFGRFAGALLLLMYLGLVGYLVVPTVPPWMAADVFHLIPPIRHLTEDVYNVALPSLKRAFDTNPIAAMPSLHAAFPALCALVAFRHFGAWGWALVAYLGLVTLAIVYLGEHYVLDAVAGVLLAGAVYWLAYRTGAAAAVRRWEGARRRPGAPAPADGGLGPGKRFALALLLLLAAEGVGQAVLRLARPLAFTEAFVRREVLGRSDVGTFHLGLAAYRARDYAAAERALARAVTEVRDDRLAAQAHELLALAHFQQGAFPEGERVLTELAARQPGDPTALYWLTRYRYLARRLSPSGVREAIARLDAHPDRTRAGPFARELAALLAAGEAPAGR